MSFTLKYVHFRTAAVRLWNKPLIPDCPSHISGNQRLDFFPYSDNSSRITFANRCQIIEELGKGGKGHYVFHLILSSQELSYP